MLLGFKRCFESYILEGSKTHTIRAKRKQPPKIGETCHCYGDIRQKSMHLLGRWKCTGVQDIRMRITGRDQEGFVRSMDIYIDGMLLTFEEASMLAWRDGFRPSGSTQYRPGPSLQMMANHWTDRFRDGEWVGDLIHWRFPELLLSANAEKPQPTNER